jgi:transcriptional regulator with GAF, ATPase, and Fis domain
LFAGNPDGAAASATFFTLIETAKANGIEPYRYLRHLLKMSIQGRYRFNDIIGRSPAMQMVYGLISKAAASRYPVVIYGESGTGKELAAKTIHSLRFTAGEPFVTVNCGAITESLFERELVTAKEHLQTRYGTNRVSWTPPTEVRCFSMKSAICPRPCK